MKACPKALGLLMACVASVAAAEGAGGAHRQLDQIVEDPATRSTIGGGPSRISVEAGTDKTTASAKLGRSWSNDGVNAWKVALSATSPFDSETETTRTLGTLSGLTEGTSAQLEFGYFHWPQPNYQGMNEVCARAIEAMFPGYSWWVTGKPYDQYRYFNLGGKDNALGATDCAALLSSLEGVEDAIKKRNDASQGLTPAAGATPPSPATLPANWEALQQEYRRRYLDAKNHTPDGTLRGAARGITFALTGNREDFSFADPAAPADVTDESKKGRGVSVAYTHIADRFVAGAGLSWEKTYEGAPAQQICSPIGASGSSSCRSAALAPPAEKQQRIAFLEMRVALFDGAIALSPRLEYSLEDYVFAARLPIFVARNRAKALEGGVALTWDEQDDLGASVFVGKSFEFFN